MIMIIIIIATGSQMLTRQDMRRPDAIKPSTPPSPEQQQKPWKCAVKSRSALCARYHLQKHRLAPTRRTRRNGCRNAVQIVPLKPAFYAAEISVTDYSGHCRRSALTFTGRWLLLDLTSLGGTRESSGSLSAVTPSPFGFGP